MKNLFKPSFPPLTLVSSCLLCISILFISCQNNNANPQDTTKDAEAIKAVLKNIESNWSSGNFYTYYADDAISMPPGRPALIGKAAVKKDLDDFFSHTTSNYTIDVVDEVRVSGDMGVARLLYTEIQTSKTNGDIKTIKGKEIIVFNRQTDGSWKLAIDIWNFNH